MAETEGFKLREDLEGLVNNVKLVKSLEPVAANSRFENVAGRQKLASSFSDPRYLAIAPAEVRTLFDQRKTNELEQLELGLDDEFYQKAVEFYFSALGNETRAGYTGYLIEEGVVPKEPSKELAEVITRIRAARAIESALNSEDINSAKAIANKAANNYQKTSLTIDSLHSGEAYRRDERDTLQQIADAQRGIAYGSIAKHKLYDEVAKAVPENKLGKAISLTGLYQAYDTQKEINKAKEEAAKKDGK